MEKRKGIALITVCILSFSLLSFVVGDYYGWNRNETQLNSLLELSYQNGWQHGNFTGFIDGMRNGYIKGIQDLANHADLEVTVTEASYGKFNITVYYTGVLIAKGYGFVDLAVEHRRNGTLLSYDRHAGMLTNLGKEWIEQQVSGTSNITQGIYISCSASTTANSATWTDIPSEITTNGFARAAGAYASTGTGAWNVTKTFTSTGTQAVQKFGLSTKSAGNGGGLICVDDAAAPKNTVTDDTVKATFQISVT